MSSYCWSEIAIQPKFQKIKIFKLFVGNNLSVLTEAYTESIFIKQRQYLPHLWIPVLVNWLFAMTMFLRFFKLVDFYACLEHKNVSQLLHSRSPSVACNLSGRDKLWGSPEVASLLACSVSACNPLPQTCHCPQQAPVALWSQVAPVAILSLAPYGPGTCEAIHRHLSSVWCKDIVGCSGKS